MKFQNENNKVDPDNPDFNRNFIYSARVNKPFNYTQSIQTKSNK